MPKLRSFVTNQRGLTLVELLAVVVILGIIAAIAVPSIGAIIDNNKKDAHIANAEQMVNATRMAQASNVEEESSDTGVYTLEFLMNEGFIENISSPGNKGEYDPNTSNVVVSKDGGRVTYTVTLNGTEDDHNYINIATGISIEALRGNKEVLGEEYNGDLGRDLIDLD